MIPLETAASGPSPFESSTLIGRIFERQAIPAVPSPLSPSAAITPATCVPCDESSQASGSSLTKSYPSRTFGSRSGWASSTPVSSTATMTFGLPVVTSQTASIPIFRKPHWNSL